MAEAAPVRFLPRILGLVKSNAQGLFDISVSMVSQGIGIIVGLGSSILLARGLGPDAMGQYALILSISTLTVTLSDLGVGQTAIRFASRAAAQGREDTLFAVLRWAFRLRIVLVLAISLVAFLIAGRISRDLWHAAGLAPLVRIALLAGLFTAVAAVPGIYFQSVRRFQMNAAVSILQAVFSFCGVLVLFFLHSWKLEWVVILSVMTAAVSAVAMGILVPKKVFFGGVKADGPGVRGLRGFIATPDQEEGGTNTFAFFMMLSSVAVALTMRADVWLMGIFVPAGSIGQYSVANRFTMPLTVLLGALNTILWPRASALTERHQIVKLLRKLAGITGICGALCLLYSFFGPQISPFLFGERYRGTVLLGQLLCLRYSVAILVSPIGIIGYSFGLVRQYWIVNIVQLVAVCVLNIFLLPRIGVMGSVVALIANELIGFGYTAIAILRKLRNRTGAIA